MADGVTFDFSQLFAGLDFANIRVQHGVERGVKRIVDDLKEASERLAPKLSGNLRSHIAVEVTTARGRVVGVVSYRAISKSKSGWGFDYALHLHEMPRIKDPTTPGTGPQFLSRPLKSRAARYQKILAEEIAKELR